MRNKLFAIAAALVVGGTLVASPAQADSGKNSCVLNLDTKAYACYSSFSAAVSAVTGGKVKLKTDDARAAVNDPSFHAQTEAAASYLIHIQYWNANYNQCGSGTCSDYTLGLWGSRECTTTTNDTDYSVADLGKYENPGHGTWNNKISSYQVGGKCLQNSWDNINYRAASTGYRGHQSHLSDIGWNDRIASIKWS
ncbi:hypothetical protein WEI85_37810 [Actinomycetes bacterium KLBMP 9797]